MNHNNRLTCLVSTLVLYICATVAEAQSDKSEQDRRQEFLKFIQTQAAQLHAADKPPATRDEWQARRVELRRRLEQAWGGFPAEPCPLEPKKLGELQRDGYRIEKIVFQTRPGVWMTANAYVPDRPGKLPAIVSVHGHWRGAKQDPVPQARCIGPAKLGYFVLAVDAFGAGERGLGEQLGEYHGEMVGATLFPVGLPLSGLQVYENMRAVDYLRSRPEVDPDRIGITGASGGGNQTMYAGAWDERFGAVVPVCSVGNYQAYLGAACCMCEVVPGALGFTEEWGVLALTAPRGLMVVNATKDGKQFSVPEAKKSLALVEPIYRLYDCPDHVRHAVFDWHHDYSSAMREAMYGWMALHLKGEGDGSPIPDPEIKTEDPETLRCYPGDSRPDDWMTIPKFAAAEARKLLASRAVSATAADWSAEAETRRKALIETVFGGFPKPSPLELGGEPASGNRRTFTFSPEPGLHLTATQTHGPAADSPLAILLDLDGADQAAASPLAAALRDSGWSIVTIDLRATGQLALPNDKIGRAPDHNTAEWSLWLGRPLLGQWSWDVHRLLDALTETDGKLPKKVGVIGRGPAGLVALCSAATDKRITHVAAVDSLASYVTDVPYEGQRLGILALGILRDIGDVSHVAALCSPRRTIIAGGVHPNGQPLTSTERQATFDFAAKTWKLSGAAAEFRLIDSNDAAKIADALR